MSERFEVHSSRTLVVLLLAVHLLAVGAVCLTDLVFWARTGIVLLIVASLIHQLYHHLYGKQSWRSFTLDRQRVLVNTTGKNELQGELTQQTVVTPFCIVLCARMDGYRLPVCQVIFHDAMQADDFRDLRVRLRFA